MTVLARPTPEIMGHLRRHAVIECGAGSGLWLRAMREAGINAVGIDPVPRGADVIEADHTRLAEWRDRLLLIVWPPDATDLGAWIEAHGGEHCCVVGSFARFSLPEIAWAERGQIEPGAKGGSEWRMT